MITPTGTLVWTLRDEPSRRTPSLYTTDCYVDQLADQWVVLVIRGDHTVLSETCPSREHALRRAGEARRILLHHGWTDQPVA